MDSAAQEFDEDCDVATPTTCPCDFPKLEEVCSVGDEGWKPLQSKTNQVGVIRLWFGRSGLGSWVFGSSLGPEIRALQLWAFWAFGLRFLG